MVSEWIQLTPVLGIYALALVPTIGLTAYAVVQSRAHGFTRTALSFIGLGTGVSIWILSRSFELLFVSQTLSRFWLGVLYVGFGLSLVSTLFFGLSLSGRDELVNWHTFGIVSAFPLVVTVLAFTNQFHELLWTGEFVTVSGWYGEGLLVHDRSFQPLFFVYILYSVLAFVGGLVLLLHVALVSSAVHRTQIVALILGVVSSLLLGMLFALQLQPFVPPYIDLSPVGYAIACVCWFYAAFRYQFLEIDPVARHTILESITDGVLVLDGQHRLVDANPMARELLGIEDLPVGSNPVTALENPELEGTIERLTGGAGGSEAVDVAVGDRYLSMSATALPGAQRGGSVLILTDVTDRRRREQEIRAREQDLSMLKEVFSRVFRHNVRNELSVVRGHLEVLATGIEDDTLGGSTTAALDSTDRLLSHTGRAREIERIIDDRPTRQPQALEPLVDRALSAIDGESEAESVVSTVGDEWVLAVDGFDVAIRNAVENALEHNPSPVEVHISAAERDEEIVLSIADTGAGIPTGEIAVLDDEEETSLSHGSGVGLWVMKWYAEACGGSLDIEVLPEGGTRVAFSLEATSPPSAG